MNWYIWIWKNPQSEGPKEGDLVSTTPFKCSSVEHAMKVAEYQLRRYTNVKVEIVQVEEPWPEEYVS